MFSLIAAGALVGLLVGMTGMGGGALLTPLLVLVFGLPPTAAVSSDLLVAAGLKLTGSVVHQARGDVHWGIVRWLSLGGVPAALVGPLVTHAVGPTPALHSVLRVALGVVLIGVSLITVLAVNRWRTTGSARSRDVPVRRGRTVLLGAVTGLLVGFTSVGSGSIVVACLLLAYPALRMASLVATDVVQALPMIVTAALGHALLGDFHVSIAWPLLVGGLPAVVVGALLAPRVPGQLLRVVLAVLLASTGAAMLTDDIVVVVAAAAVIVAFALAGKVLRREKAAAKSP